MLLAPSIGRLYRFTESKFDFQAPVISVKQSAKMSVDPPNRRSFEEIDVMLQDLRAENVRLSENILRTCTNSELVQFLGMIERLLHVKVLALEAAKELNAETPGVYGALTIVHQIIESSKELIYCYIAKEGYPEYEVSSKFVEHMRNAESLAQDLAALYREAGSGHAANLNCNCRSARSAGR